MMKLTRVIQYPNLSYKDRIKQLEQNSYNQRQAELEQAFLSPDYWQILNKVEHKNQIKAELNLKNGGTVPIDIEVRKKVCSTFEPKTIYTFKKGVEKIGYLELIEKSNGAHIFKVENFDQSKYGGVGILSDRIAVENCLKRGLTDFEITGDAIWNSHAAHYLSGKRFKPIENLDRAKLLKKIYGTSNPNKIVKFIIENTPKGEKYYTDILKTVPFYLPEKLIEKYIKLAKTSGILK